jgi:predicted DCC family thiol-disulfide oxidoreductase YuxK
MPLAVDAPIEPTPVVFTQSDAAIQVMVASGGLWRLASLARWVPRRLRDELYGVVARNRYRWFGKRASCYLPP